MQSHPPNSAFRLHLVTLLLLLLLYSPLASHAAAITRYTATTSQPTITIDTAGTDSTNLNVLTVSAAAATATAAATAAAAAATTTTSFEPEPVPTMMIDILSAQPQFSYFLRILQRHQMVPKLNLLRNVTLLAPVNLAFAGVKNNGENNDEELDFYLMGGARPDETLFRYVINQTLVLENMTEGEVVYDTLYNNGKANVSYPIIVRNTDNQGEWIVDESATIVEQDLYAKHQWSYVQAVDLLLPVKSSMCDVLLNGAINEVSLMSKIFDSLFDNDDDDDDDDVSGDDNDVSGDDDYEASRGNKNKNEKRKKRKTRKGKKKKQKLKIPKTCEEFTRGVKTIILPTDQLLKDSLSALQLDYYLANSADESFVSTEDAVREIKQDTLNLLRHLMFVDYVAGVNGTLDKVISLAGKKQQFLLNEKQGDKKVGGKSSISVGGFPVSQTHVLANGILQIFDVRENDNEKNSTSTNTNTKTITTTTTIPNSFSKALFFEKLKIPTVEMIARKALYAAHYSAFVSELEFRSLDYLIDGSSSNQTIFIDVDLRDDVDDDNEIFASSFSLKQEFLYHFIDGVMNFTNHDHILADTKLCVKKKLGGCYKIKISNTSEEDGKQMLRIGDGIEVLLITDIANDSQIIIGNEELSPPVNLKHSLGDLMSTDAIPKLLEGIKIDRQSCLKTLNYLSTFELYSLDDNGEGYTILLPCGESHNGVGLWNELGLILKYLENNPKLFKDITQGMFLEGTLYSDFAGKSSFRTIGKSGEHLIDVESEGIKNEINYLLIQNTGPRAVPLNSDVLFNQGVIHVINEFLLPESFRVPIWDLIETTIDPSFPQYSITKLLKHYPKIESSLTGKRPFSLLVPSAESLENFNITSSFTDLLEFLEFHLIPNEEVGKILECIHGDNSGSQVKGSDDNIIKTNLTNGGLTCRHQKGTDKILLNFRKLNNTTQGKGATAESYNKDQEVRLLSHGCTSLRLRDRDTKNISCVFLLDKPLNLEWFKDKHKGDNFLHVHLGIVSVGIGIILGLTLFAGVMLGLVLCVGRKDRDHRRNHKKGVGADDEIPRADSGFMSVLTEDDEEDNNDFLPYDRGYETDIDLLRLEQDALLPSHLKRKKKIRLINNGYGSIDKSVGDDSMNRRAGTRTRNTTAGVEDGDDDGGKTVQATLPRDIGNVRKTLNRDRNIPGVSQF